MTDQTQTKQLRLLDVQKTEFLRLTVDEITNQFLAPPPDADLIESILAEGVIQPILVCPGNDGKYYPYSGKRRTTAVRILIKRAEEAGDAEGADKLRKYEIPSLLRVDLTPETARHFELVANNLGCQNLLTDLTAIQLIVNEKQLDPMHDQDDMRSLCKLCGIPTATAVKLLDQLNAPSGLIDALISGNVTPAVFDRIRKLPDSEQKSDIVAKVASGVKVKAKEIYLAGHQVKQQASQAVLEGFKPFDFDEYENPKKDAKELLSQAIQEKAWDKVVEVYEML